VSGQSEITLLDPRMIMTCKMSDPNDRQDDLFPIGHRQIGLD